MTMHKHGKLNVWKKQSLRVYKMPRNIASTKCHKIGGLRKYQRGGNLEKGEVNFERGGGSNPLGNYAHEG